MLNEIKHNFSNVFYRIDNKEPMMGRINIWTYLVSSSDIWICDYRMVSKQLCLIFFFEIPI